MCNIQVSTSRQLFLILFCLFFNFNFNFLEFNIAQRTYGLLGTVCVCVGGGGGGEGAGRLPRLSHSSRALAGGSCV